jgi:hypothetical protein
VGERTNFRQSDKNIGCDWRQIPVRLRQLLDNTQFWLTGQVFALDELAVRFHHQLVLIPMPFQTAMAGMRG